jgi:transposase
MAMSRRCIGLDVHRDFAQVAIWQGGAVRANSLAPTDEVALEVTGNTWAIASLLASCAARVVVSNPAKTRAIAEAKIKTDKVDAAILAELLAADFLPAVRRSRTVADRRESESNRPPFRCFSPDGSRC